MLQVGYTHTHISKCTDGKSQTIATNVALRVHTELSQASWPAGINQQNIETTRQHDTSAEQAVLVWFLILPTKDHNKSRMLLNFVECMSELSQAF